MRPVHPFRPEDLAELDDRFLTQASAVVSLREVHAGNRNPDVIGLRHDCDSEQSLSTAVDMAEWEYERGYRSTYFVLHTSPYWGNRDFREALETIALWGHEIGIHSNALAEALRTGRDPDLILAEAIGKLRSYGHQVRGVAGHGDGFCNRDKRPGEIDFANDEQFTECSVFRGQLGEPDRVVTRGKISLKLAPRPLEDFGLDYEALLLGLPDPWRISDSGGRWVHSDMEPSFDEHADKFGSEVGIYMSGRRQMHMLVHPDWWSDAFSPRYAAAAA